MTMIDLTKRNFEEAEQDGFGTGARFSKAPKSFRARKAIFRSSVSKNGEEKLLARSETHFIFRIIE